MRQVHTNVHKSFVLTFCIIAKGLIGFNGSLSVGIIGFILLLVLVTATSCLLVACISEVESGTSLNGGLFLHYRCIAGFYPGFISVCCQLFVFLVISVRATDQIVQSITDAAIYYAVPISLLLYVMLVAFLSRQGKQLYGFLFVLSFYVITIAFVFIVGNVSNIKVSESALLGHHHSQNIDRNFMNWLDKLPEVIYMFVGVETFVFPIRSLFPRDSRGIYPSSAIKSIVFVVIITILLSIVSSSFEDDIDSWSSHSSIYRRGLSRIFNLSSRQIDLLTLLPINLSILVSSSLASLRKIAIMIDSHLLPGGSRHTSHNDFHRVVVYSSLCWICYCMTQFDRMILNHLLNAGIFAALISYLSYCYVIYIFKTKFKAIQSASSSQVHPLGIALMFIVYLLTLVSMFIRLSSVHTYQYMIILMGYLTLISLYYHFFAKHHQKFSEAEIKLTFGSMVVRHNQRMMAVTKKGSHLKNIHRRRFFSVSSASSVVPLSLTGLHLSVTKPVYRSGASSRKTSFLSGGKRKSIQDKSTSSPVPHARDFTSTERRQSTAKTNDLHAINEDYSGNKNASSNSCSMSHGSLNPSLDVSRNNSHRRASTGSWIDNPAPLIFTNKFSFD